MTLPQSTTGRVHQRVCRVLKDIVPGAKFPVGYTPAAFAQHREITSDLGGRVFPLMLGWSGHPLDQLPALEVTLTESDASSDPMNRLLNVRMLPITVVGYCADPATGSARNTDGGYDVSPFLDALAADIIVAMQAVPWWTGPGDGENIALRQMVGDVEIKWIRDQPRNVYAQQATGDVAISYELRYFVNELAA